MGDNDNEQRPIDGDPADDRPGWMTKDPKDGKKGSGDEGVEKIWGSGGADD